MTTRESTTTITVTPTAPIPHDDSRLSVALVNRRFVWEVSFLGTDSSAKIWSICSVICVSLLSCWQSHEQRQVEEEFRVVFVSLMFGSVDFGFLWDDGCVDSGKLVRCDVSGVVVVETKADVVGVVRLTVTVFTEAASSSADVTVQTVSLPLVSWVTVQKQNKYPYSIYMFTTKSTQKATKLSITCYL